MGIYEAGAVVNLLRYEPSGKFSDEAAEFLSLAPRERVLVLPLNILLGF